MGSPADLMRDADDAVKLVSGLLRRGESGEAFRERTRTETWTASESGLLAPALAEESGTAVRIRREGSLLLVARSGAAPGPSGGAGGLQREGFRPALGRRRQTRSVPP